jgi:hypothetical protein
VADRTNESFEGAGNGANVTSATVSAGTVSAGTTLKHSNAWSVDGLMSGEINGTAAQQARWNYASTLNHYTSLCGQHLQHPGSIGRFWTVRNETDAAAAYQFGIDTAGHLTIRNADNGTIVGGTRADSAYALALNEPYIAEITAISATDITLVLLAGDDIAANTVTETISCDCTATGFTDELWGPIATITAPALRHRTDRIRTSTSAMPARPTPASPTVEGDVKWAIKDAGVLKPLKWAIRDGGVLKPLFWHRRSSVPLADNILVPDQGMWWGASCPAAAGQGTTQAGVDIFTGVTNRRPQALRFYKQNDNMRTPTAAERALLEPTGQARAIGVYSLKPSAGGDPLGGVASWADIAAGARDDRLRAAARSVRTYPFKLFFTVHHEPEDNSAATGGNSWANYRAMYRHSREIFDDEGAENLIWYMNYQGYYGHADFTPDLYPGDDVVDWIFYDPYSRDGNDRRFDDLANRTHASKPDWPGFYSWATTEHPGKPIGIGEWGIDFTAHSVTTAAGILDSTADDCQSLYPWLKLALYWNQILSPDDFRLQGRGTTLQAAARRWASAPYLNLASTANAA